MICFMGKIISGYIFPHPPLIIPEIGRGREQEVQSTLTAMKRASGDIKRDNPGTVILISPHGPVFRDHIYISEEKVLKGDFRQFGIGDLKLEFKNNTSLAKRIILEGEKDGFSAGDTGEALSFGNGLKRELDHGALVPLYFVKKELKDFKLIYMAFAHMPYNKLHDFGKAIRRAVEASEENVSIIASGDLSHRLKADGPYGYRKEGAEFDKKLIDSILKTDIDSILNMEENFTQTAGECGLRSIIIMLGALNGSEIKPELYSYEGTLGVGYSVMKVGIQEGTKKAAEAEDVYVKLAKEALETYVKRGKHINIPRGLPDEMINKKAGVFVSLKKAGRLRGCIGTVEPVRKNIAEEIIYNAISAGTQDPRFFPVTRDEIEKLVYSVDVLNVPEPVDSMELLDVKKYGVIVSKGRRRGLLLPNLDGVDTPMQQIEIALEKAGIDKDEDYSLERFLVERHELGKA